MVFTESRPGGVRADDTDLASSVAQIMKHWTTTMCAEEGADGKGALSLMPDGEWSTPLPNHPHAWWPANVDAFDSAEPFMKATTQPT